MSLLDESHVWILPQFNQLDWWKLEENVIFSLHSSINCSNKEMLEIFNTTNIIVVDSLKYSIPGYNLDGDIDEQFYVIVSIINY